MRDLEKPRASFS